MVFSLSIGTDLHWRRETSKSLSVYLEWDFKVNAIGIFLAIYLVYVFSWMRWRIFRCSKSTVDNTYVWQQYLDLFFVDLEIRCKVGCELENCVRTIKQSIIDWQMSLFEIHSSHKTGPNERFKTNTMHTTPRNNWQWTEHANTAAWNIMSRSFVIFDKLISEYVNNKWHFNNLEPNGNN